MRYDRDMWRRGARSRGFSARRDVRGGPEDWGPRGEYGEAYEGPFPRRGWSEGFQGLPARGRFGPRGRGTFEWGGGYVGGRGYGGTNYDLEHGYATGGSAFRIRPPRGEPRHEGETPFSSPATRGGYAWGEAEASEDFGPARYGYGPYFDRLRRRRRSDVELRQEVEDTLFYDTWVDADAISIAVEDAVVTLRGTLPSYEELRYAVDDAWDVDGVRGVRSELQVEEMEEDIAPAHEIGPAEDIGPGEEPRRYRPGAPHMHGHPRAREHPVEREAEQSGSTARAEAPSARREGTRGKGEKRGRSGGERASGEGGPESAGAGGS